MKLRNTLLLLALVAGLFVYIQWVDKGKPSTFGKRTEEIHPAQFDEDKITTVTIKNRDLNAVQFSQKDNVWRLESPLKDRAQDFDVKSMIGQLGLLNLVRVSDTPPTKDQLKAYGLLKPEFTVKVEADKPLEISFGEETTLRGRYYVKVEGRDLVYMAQTSIREMLVRKPEEWRNRTLSEVAPQNVKKFTLKTANGEIEVTRSGRYWSLTKPLKARADQQKVGDFLANALNAQVQEFVPGAKDLGALGLAEPRATFTFVADGTDTPAVLEIGAVKVEKEPPKKDGEKPAEPKIPTKNVYVKMTGREGVVTIPGDIEVLLQTQPKDLRDRNIMRIQEASVNRLTIESPGKEKVVLEKTLAKNQISEEWVRKVAGKSDQPVNTGAASKLLSELANGKTITFVADLASDLKGFGLDQPQVTVTVGDFSEGNTAETNAGEREQARLLLGRADTDGVYAKLSDEPFIITIPKSLLESIWTDPIQWRPISVKDLKADDVVALEVTRFGQASLNLVREGKVWKLAKGDTKVSQAAVESLVNTLTDLKAVRWLGPTKPEHGLEKPNLTITYTLADKKTGKVQIGAVNPGPLWNACVDGEKATFFLAGPSFDALNAALVETPKTSSAADPSTPGATAAAPTPTGPAHVAVPPAEESPKPAESTKPTEAPAPGPKPTPEPETKGK